MFCGWSIPRFRQRSVTDSYHQLLLEVALMWAQIYYEQQWAEQLFDALVLRPVTPTDAELGLRFLQVS